MGVWQKYARLRLMCKKAADREREAHGVGAAGGREAGQEREREREKIPWHIIEGHFGAKLLIDKSTNLPGRR